MNGLPRVITLFFVTFCVRVQGFGESESVTPASRSPASDLESNPILKPRAAGAATPKRPRAMSDAMAARFAEVLPKPPPPSPAAAPAPPEALVEEARSPVLRLPRYFVREDRLPPLNEAQMLTKEGRRALELKRHPGLILSEGQHFFSWAEEMAQEDLAIQRDKEMGDLFDLLPTNGGHAKALKNATPRRSNSWVETGGSFQQHRRGTERVP